MKIKKAIENTHYAWIITLGASLVFFFSAGLSGGTFIIFLPAIIEQMDISYSQASFILTLTGLVGLFVMLFVRSIITRIGIRRTIFIGGTLITLGTLITSTLKSLVVLYLGGTIIGIGFGLCSAIPIAMLIVRWFEKRIGFAMGLSFAGSGIAVIVGTPIFSYILINFGLRTAYIILAFSILVATILATMLIRDYPKLKNLEPYGYSENKEVYNIDEGVFEDYTKNDNRRFILFLLILVVMTIPIKSIVSHMSSILISRGVDSYIAMNMVSIYGFSMVISKMTYGYVMDRLGTYKTILMTFPIWLFTISLYFVLEANILFVILYSLIIGMGPAIGTVPVAVWVTELFNKKNVEKYLTLSQIFMNFGASIGVFILGIFVDITGDYRVGMIFMFSLSLIAFIVLASLYRTRRSTKLT